MLEIGILGPLRVKAGGAEYIPAGTKLCTILAVLALRPSESVRRDELIEELGLDQSTRDAVNTLHVHIGRLRAWLGDHFDAREVLVTRGCNYLLDVDPHQIDAHRFTSAVEGVWSSSLEGNPATVFGTLRPALALWRGLALSGVGDGLICQLAARVLAASRASAYEMLIDSLLATGQEYQAIQDLESLIGQHPYRERLWEQLMIALYQCGRPVEAVQTYHQFRRKLASELGLEPSPALRDRLQAILNHAPSNHAPSPGPGPWI